MLSNTAKRTPQKKTNQILISYVWVDASKRNLRSTTKTVNFVPSNAQQLPLVRVDGAETSAGAEFYLQPVKLYRDPIRRAPNLLALCETVTFDLQPTAGNSRRSCLQTMKAAAAEAPWFGIEQEYFMMDATSGKILGWPKTGRGEPDQLESHYFAVGRDRVVGRQLANIHYAACLYAGLKIDGLNAEASLGQWEYQIGPCEGVSIGDDLWMSRYLLHRLAEDLSIRVTFEPKPIQNGMFGSGAHTNFSTASTRAKGGMAAIYESLKKLEARHLEHIAVYDLDGGKENAQRLVPGPVSAAWQTFSWGLADRAKSIRVPAQTVADGKGYLEDRRPAANIDPYAVAEALVRTVCL